MRLRLLGLVAGFSLSLLFSQSTQGLIAGRVLDRTTRRPIANALVEAACATPEIRRQTWSGDNGIYTFPDLPPGQYSLTVARESFQRRELHELRLDVAGYLQIDFELRPLSDLWESGRYRSAIFRNESVLTYFGPDVDPAYSGNFEPERAGTGQLNPSVSEVIDPGLIRSLPLAGRDVYTAIVLLPGIASDTTTVRSIGLSANGQRPTSSNFLLDGADDNNHVITGPLVSLPPEAIQEYRVSTNNFSAEYGASTGYVANAITRSAGLGWHGVMYLNWKNSILNANGFQRNANALARTPYGEIQPGFWAGGPLAGRKWTVSSAFESFHAHSTADAMLLNLPTERFYESLPANSFARRLLDAHKPAFWGPGDGDSGEVGAAAPILLDRYTALARIDYVPSARHRLMFRGDAGSLTNAAFRWTPYGSSPLKQNTVGVAATYAAVWTPAFTTELRLGVHRDRLGWGLVNSDLPVFSVSAGPMLPGACCGAAYEDRSLNSTADFGAIWTSGRHMLKAGGGWMDIRMQDRLEYEPHGVLYFSDSDAFRQDQPYQLEAIVSRLGAQSGQYQLAATANRHSRNSGQAYVQEDFRVTPNLTLNAGVRYEYFGRPAAARGAEDALVTVTGGLPSPLLSGVSDANLFNLRGGAWAGRFGASYSPEWRRNALAFRAGYGMFHEGIYDNLWSELMANDYLIGAFNTTSCPLTLGSTGPPPSALASRCYIGSSDFLDLTAFTSPMRIPSVQSFFASAQLRPAQRWTLVVNGLGSAGRRLFSTDVINRDSDAGRPTASLPDVYYRGNDAKSHYAALSVSGRYQATRAGLRIYYTWSHSIDNQSDPLLGQFFDLGFSNQTDLAGRRYYGAFTFQGNRDVDIGNSDFDQRHNLAAFSYWELPALKAERWRAVTQGWRVSQTFVMRSGLPYSVFAGDLNCFPVCNTRANLIAPGAIYSTGRATLVPGAQQVLNPEAFAAPGPGKNGNTGRNAFGGPGFWNLDFSLARVLAVTESIRIELRADAFNLLNHVNLQAPDAYWGLSEASPNVRFGAAPYGRTQKSGFPALIPFVENARQIQVLVRARF